MLKNIYKLLILIAVCVGLYYYIHTNHIDLKSLLFSSNCDCHAGGCSIGNPTLDGQESSSEPVENVTTKIATVQTATTPKPIVNTALTPQPKAETEISKKVTASDVAGKTTPPIIVPMEKPVSTPAAVQ